MAVRSPSSPPPPAGGLTSSCGCPLYPLGSRVRELIARSWPPPSAGTGGVHPSRIDRRDPPTSGSGYRTRVPSRLDWIGSSALRGDERESRDAGLASIDHEREARDF